MSAFEEGLLNEYDQVLIGRRDRISPFNPANDEGINERYALVVFKYVIEDLLGWDPKDAESFFTYDMAKLMKVDDLLKYIRFPDDFSPEDAEYVVWLLYPTKIRPDRTKYRLRAYEAVLNGAKYPRDYMIGNEGEERAKVCFLEAVEKKARPFISVRDMYRYFASPEGSRFIKAQKLDTLREMYYTGALEYLHASLCREQARDLYYLYYYYSREYRHKYKGTPPGMSKVG